MRTGLPLSFDEMGRGSRFGVGGRRALGIRFQLLHFRVLGLHGSQPTPGPVPQSRILRTVSVFERAPLGEAAEKLGLSIGYSPPFGESLGPFRDTQMPFMPPNGAIPAEQYCRRR